VETDLPTIMEELSRAGRRIQNSKDLCSGQRLDLLNSLASVRAILNMIEYVREQGVACPWEDEA